MNIKLTINGVWCYHDPKPDITPLEAAWLTHFLVVITNHCNFISADIRDGFIEEHGLSRHFTPCSEVDK